MPQNNDTTKKPPSQIYSKDWINFIVKTKKFLKNQQYYLHQLSKNTLVSVVSPLIGLKLTSVYLRARRLVAGQISAELV